MKLSERKYTKEDMTAELSAEFDIGLDVARQIAGWIIDNYVNELAQLEAKLMDIECSECEKTLLECECDS